MLLVASYIFYAAWDWRFLSILFIIATVDYFCGLKIYESGDERIRNFFLILSITVNLCFLGFFKYFDFFSTNLAAFLGHFSLKIHPLILKIALPLGISFYTFRSMSYTIDVYTGKMKPTRNYLDYALFVAFFPVLLAGPITKASDFLPQIISSRKLNLNSFYEGCYLMFWGLFQKVFIADNLTKIADPLFNSPPPYNGVMILLAIYAFAFQIYCDFAGYSNIARGLSKCMGFDIVVNFNLPYFSTNPKEFWRRWHISLSTWLHDYLFSPIAFSKRGWGKWGVIFALMVTFILCGFWHGAAWTFIIWGAYQGILLATQVLLEPRFKKMPLQKNIFVKKIWFFIKVVFFFHLVCFGWLLFRAQSLTQAYRMTEALICNFKFTNGSEIKFISISLIFYTCILIIIQIFQFLKNDHLFILKTKPALRAAFYVVCFCLLTIFGVSGGKEFIYFQF